MIRHALVVAVASLAACGGSPELVVPPPAPTTAPSASALAGASAGPITPDAPFRQKAPAAGPAVTFVPPTIQEARLSNGIRVLLVERHELPIVAINIALDRGADQGGPGLGSFVGTMLLQGTKTRSALAISDELEKLGATYGSSVDYDGADVYGQCLTAKLPDVLAVLADVLEHPAFDKQELERERSRRLTAIEQQKDSPGALLVDALDETLYPAGHPYAEPLIGNAQTVKKVGPEELSRFHAAQFRPDRATVAVAGDITKDRAVAALERVLGSWKGKAAKGRPVPEPPPGMPTGPRVVVVDRPGASQSNVAVTLPGVSRKSKDFDALTVLNTILGGQFSSRLNLNLREKHAYTYGARSGFDWRHGAGPFSAGGAIVADKTDAAIREILSELDRVRNEPVTEAELADAKSALIEQLPSRFETVGQTAGTLAALAIYDLPLDEFATRPERYRKITADDVQRVARTYLLPERMRVVVVGDASLVKPGLEKLGLGTSVVRTPADVLQSGPAPAATKKP